MPDLKAAMGNRVLQQMEGQSKSRLSYEQLMAKIPELPECKSEDDTNCFWDAKARGNGEGQSFADIDGEFYPVDPEDD